jgi:hypothetical protein
MLSSPQELDGIDLAVKGDDCIEFFVSIL